MTASLLVIHILLAISLIAVILFQRSSSDGGALTGGGSMGGLMTVRGTANLLTRITSFLATAFICTSILLTILAGSHNRPRSLVDQLDVNVPAPGAPAMPTPAGPQSTPAPAAPAAPAPATPTVPLSK
jgi:preprotein translocase subunit SecG